MVPLKLAQGYAHLNSGKLHRCWNNLLTQQLKPQRKWLKFLIERVGHNNLPRLFNYLSEHRLDQWFSSWKTARYGKSGETLQRGFMDTFCWRTANIKAFYWEADRAGYRGFSFKLFLFQARQGLILKKNTDEALRTYSPGLKKRRWKSVYTAVKSLSITLSRNWKKSMQKSGGSRKG